MTGMNEERTVVPVLCYCFEALLLLYIAAVT